MKTHFTEAVDQRAYRAKEVASLRDGFGKGLLALGASQPEVVALCADLTESTRMHWFKEAFPERFFEMGITEQNMAVVAAGMAAMGKVPFMSSYAMFSPGRNWDQIRNAIAYSGLPVKIVGSHAGVSVGPDGGTHQALEDIALMRVIPTMEVVVPADAVEASQATQAIAKTPHPSYLRLARAQTPRFIAASHHFELGKSYPLWEAPQPDVLVAGAGPILYEALVAAEELAEQGIDVVVLNVVTVKPLDTETLLDYARKVKAVVTVEEHQVHAGVGSAIAEVLAQKMPLPMQMVGVQDLFGQSGSPEELVKEYGLTAAHIVRAVEAALARATNVVQ